MDGDHLNVTKTETNADSTSGTLLTSNTHVADQAKKGTTVTYTLQLRYTTGTAAKNVARAGCYINVASHTGTYGAATTAIVHTSLVTDATGTATFEATNAETTAGDANDAAIKAQYLVFSAGAANALATVACPTSYTVTIGAAGATDGSADLALKWSDAARTATTVTLAAATPDVTASAASTGATNTLTATSYDQFGVGIASASVGLTQDAVPQWGNGSATLPTFTVTRTTNSAGAATFGITRDAATSAVTTFTANDGSMNYGTEVVYWTIGPVDAALEDSDAPSNPYTWVCDTAWSKNAMSTGNQSARIVVFDYVDNYFVVDLGYFSTADAAAHEIVKYSYDSNDQFTVGATAKTMAQFEDVYDGLVYADMSMVTADDIDGAGTNDCSLKVATTSSAQAFIVPAQ